MRVTARSPVLLTCLLLLAPSVHAADAHQQIVDQLADMTAYLAQDNSTGFMAGFDQNMPGYADLKRQIEGLLLDYDISSSVDPINDTGSSDKHSLDLDWYMELTSKAGTGPTIRRRKVVHCDLELKGKHWRIESLKPISFFSDRAE